MDFGKIVFFSASWLIIGVASVSGAAFAADQAAAQPGAHDMSAHHMGAHEMAVANEEQKGGEACCGEMGGKMCDHKGGMMGGQMGGKMCDHKGGMTGCDHKGDMMGGHMGGMMCNHKGGMPGCDHKGGMMGGHMGGMMCDHKGGMGEGRCAGMAGSGHMHMIMSLDLSDEQRSKINKLSDELRHNNWTTKGLIMDESAKLRDLYAADKRDPSAIGKEYQKIFDLKRKMIEATITTQNRIEEVLTPEQRTKFKGMRDSGAPMHDHPMH
jgi:hypothetical protein